ncbi:MAG: TonB-dependent receptor, partial [Gemmatimonadota bacterium]|nr:TonB-dependent receptor [Gemmatimonadota bacterium]
LFEALAPPGATVLLRAAAHGHAADSVRVVAARGRIVEVRLPLRVVPVILPGLEAAVRREAAAGARSVETVRFREDGVRWRDLGDWLAGRPGLSVRRSGGGGGQVASVRGSRPEGLLVLLDGVPLNDPLTGGADLSTVPVASLDSATLVRGAASARFGSGALGGVLLLHSRRPDGRDASGSLTTGSLGVIEADGFAALGEKDGTRLSLAVAGRRADEEFEFENRLLPGSPTETRRNADRSSVSAALAAASGRLQGALRFDGTERGSPGPMGTTLFEGARWRERRLALTGGWGGAGSALSVQAGWRGSRWDPGSGLPASDRDAWTGGVWGEAPLPWMPAVRLGGRFRWETLAGDDVQGSPSRVQAGLTATVPVRAGALRLEPAASFDAGGGATAFSPELGLRLAAGRAIALRARVGRAFRLPTFGDLHFAPAARVRANPDLGPERVSLDAELGVEGRFAPGGLRLEAEVAAWARRTDDPIVWLASAAALWSPNNLERLVSTGLEGEVRLATGLPGGPGWTVRAGGTVDRSRLGFGANRNPMPYRPSTTGFAALERRGPRFAGRAEVRWTGPRTTSVAGTRTLPGFLLVDVALSHRFGPSAAPFEIELRVEDVFDRRFELVELIPEPGRRFTVGLRMR